MNDFIPLYILSNPEKNIFKFAINLRDQRERASTKEKEYPVSSKPFYVIRPDFSPIPADMVVVCVENSPLPPYNTISMKVVYDLYNYPKCSLMFITYIVPKPLTKRLYIHEVSSDTKRNEVGVVEKNQVEGLYLSDKKPNTRFPRHLISPLSVFDSPSKFILDETNRCIPTRSGGETLKTCVLRRKKPLSLLDVLGDIQKKRFLTGEKIIVFLILILLLVCDYESSIKVK